MSIKSFRAKLSFKEGVFSIFNFDDVSNDFDFYLKESDEDIDTISLYNDWRVVGDDLRKSMNHYEQQAKSITARTSA